MNNRKIIYLVASIWNWQLVLIIFVENVILKGISYILSLLIKCRNYLFLYINLFPSRYIHFRLKKSSFILGMFYSGCKILMKTYILWMESTFTRLSIFTILWDNAASKNYKQDFIPAHMNVIPCGFDPSKSVIFKVLLYLMIIGTYGYLWEKVITRFHKKLSIYF